MRDPDFLAIARAAWDHVKVTVPAEHVWSKGDVALALARQLCFELPLNWVHCGISIKGLAATRALDVAIASSRTRLEAALEVRVAPEGLLDGVKKLRTAVRTGEAKLGVLCVYDPDEFMTRQGARLLGEWRKKYPEVEVWI